ncbi:TIGR03767 family metallophosphoesterase [Kitasatospora sp. NPDC058965]|uniref:TIGR03767 family metallophosphoesterase n=1 Tax=Kitasatospora sp. NPDC058965 TaxID=3346682 RepID=UPI00369A9C6F
MSVSRRRLLGGATAGAALSLVGGTSLWTAQQAQALSLTASRAVSTAGTTLEQVATPAAGTGYRRLLAGPGWPLVVRGELAAPGAGRDDRRTGLASFVQFTDLHLCDSESPMRFEYLARWNDAAHRPQEALTVRGASSLVERVNALAAGPYTGLPFSMVMATGDNTDNHERIELDWYLTVMSGGSVTPNSGDPSRYEGVQSSGNSGYWNPESSFRDSYKQAGFPQIPDYLGAAGATFSAPGLKTPWYTTVGNHDDSIEGTLPDLGLLNSVYTGDKKIEGIDDAEAAKLAGLLQSDPAGAVLELGRLLAGGGLVREITADGRRHPFTTKEFAQAHLNPAYTGAGPYGHGFTSDAAASGNLYYTFRIADGVLGISLDTTNAAGFADGSIGTGQLNWLEQQLRSHSGHWYDTNGNVVRGGAGGDLVVIFSHHTSTTMGNLLQDPRHFFEKRHDGNELVALLQRYPNVVAWVNGHSHENRITAHGHAVPERAFWEINTASHIDFPQHARVIELTDNGDGTVSLFTTLVESAAPYTADYSDTSDAALASFYRELSFNDPYATPNAKLGSAVDHNTELLLVKPSR